MSNKPRVGVVGCGQISKSYLRNIQRHGYLDIVAVSDLDHSRRKGAQEFNIPRVLETEQLTCDPEVEYVLNLTVPQAHLPVAMSALDAGKHVYNEKPLAVTREEASLLMDKARQKGLRLGVAPDTILGAGMQNCRRLLDEGKIGEPVGVEVVFNLRGYPDPNHFHWKRGAGVLMDIGPYYFTAMVALLGPIKRVSAFARYWPMKEVRQRFPNWRELIEVPSHVAAIVEFDSGVVGNITLTTEYCGNYDVLLKIYGSDATMVCPDPNMFDGDLIITSFGEEKLRLKAEGPYAIEGRGIGLADMAYAQMVGRQHRCNDELGYHVLDAMCAVLESAESGTAIAKLRSSASRSEPFDDSTLEKEKAKISPAMAADK